jgi:glycosyltransferase involved in cell wall biosynthesis
MSQRINEKLVGKSASMTSASLPLVSISMPAFNAEHYIAEAIESILSQSYQNFELIICDDGSTDKTRKIIDRYDDPRIIKIFSKVNRGLIATRNEIAQIAKGKYLALLDADDLAFPERLSLQVEFLESGNADLCGADHWTLNQGTGAIKPSRQRHSNADIQALLSVCSPLCNPAVMGRIEIFRAHPYLTSYIHAEDYCLWTEIALAGYKFANIPQKLIIYRLHPTQTSVNHMGAARNVFRSYQSRYLEGLGISPSYLPRTLTYKERLVFGVQFMRLINQKIANISISANCELYARFQFRGNGLWTPLTRLERLMVAISASWLGRRRVEISPKLVT